MNDKRVSDHSSGAGMTVGDVYYTLFRQKWKILILCLVGIGVAVGINYTQPPTYTSVAQLYIKYINSDNSTQRITPWTPEVLDVGVQGKLRNEAAILKTLDMSLNVVSNIGAERILKMYGGGGDKNAAAMLIQDKLAVERAFGDSTVLNVSISLRDQQLVQPLLRELIEDYSRTHMAIHSQANETYDTLRHYEVNMKGILKTAQEDYRKALNEAGVNNYVDKKKHYSARIEQLTQTIDELRVKIGAQKAILMRVKAGAGITNDSVLMNQLSSKAGLLTTNKTALAATPSGSAKTGGVTNSEAAAAADLTPAPTAITKDSDRIKEDKTADYTRLRDRLERYHKDYEQRLVEGYKETAPMMVEKLQRIKDAEAEKIAMEKKDPFLTAVAVATGGDNGDKKNNASIIQLISSSELSIAELEETMSGYNLELNEVTKAADLLETHDPKLDELSRDVTKLTREYENIEDQVDRAKLDSGLAEIRQQNISVIQQPTPPTLEASKTRKMMLIAMACGVLAGLTWAFLSELLLDHSVRRAREIEGDMGLKLFLTIPRMKKGGNRRRRGRRVHKKEVEEADGGALLPAVNGQPAEANGTMEIAPWDSRHTLHEYFESLRDRLITYFETNNLTHKPKLVAVTGSSEGCGATTLAVGLAASLSETGDGNVLLVDMNMDRGAAQHFYKGEPTMNLEVALSGETKQGAMVLDHLYVVGGNKSDKLFSMLPKRFANLMPKLQSSDYDYIIFDMPAVARTGVTQRLAGFMDMMLLVVESEKTQRHVLRQASSVLHESKAKVSVVLNKTKTYVPAQLHQEF